MRFEVLATLLALLAVGSLAEGQVANLTDSDYQSYFDSHDLVIVKLFAPWCGHCKQLAPKYVQAAKESAEKKKPYTFAEIDCTKNPKAQSHFNVSGFPTLKVLRKGKVVATYNDERTTEALIEYMDIAAGLAKAKIYVVSLTEADYEKYLSSSKELVMVHFTKKRCTKCKEFAKEFERTAKAAAKDSKPYIFAQIDCSQSTAVAKKYNVTKFPTVKLINRNTVEDYTGEKKEKDIIKFLDTRSGLVAGAGDVIEITDSTFMSYVNGSKMVMLKLFAPWCGHCKKLAPEYERAAKIAKTQNRPYAFGQIDCTVHKVASEYFKIRGYPTLKIVQNGKIDEYSGERTTEDIIKFMDDRSGIVGIKELKSLDEIKAAVANSVFRVRFVRRLIC